jgi:hemerythrin-like domain-containing protein
MSSDQEEVNNEIRSVLLSEREFDHRFLETIYFRLRRHIFIEETVLFPMLPDTFKKDVEYLEEEHCKIFEMLNAMRHSPDSAGSVETLSALLDLLVEHNSYEDSFVYYYFKDMDSKLIREILSAPEGWASQCQETHP